MIADKVPSLRQYIELNQFSSLFPPILLYLISILVALLKTERPRLTGGAVSEECANARVRTDASSRRLRQHAHIERKLIENIRSMMHGETNQLYEVPRLEGEVHDLDSLDRAASMIFQ